MLDERKVKLMTKMALYEQKEGKEDFKVSAYYRKDYASVHTIYSILWMTVGYILLIVLIGFAAMDYIEKIGFTDMMVQEELLVTHTMEGIAKIPHVHVLGSKAPGNHTGIVNFLVDDVHP